MKTEKETRTYTFQPTPEVRSLLAKARKRRKGVTRSVLINEAIRAGLAEIAGKREVA